MRGNGLLALVFALFMSTLTGQGSRVAAQPAATIALPSPGTTRQLYEGCNNISLTFPDGTSSQSLVQAVVPTPAVESVWRHDAQARKWYGFSPDSVAASDLLSVNFLDSVWLCVMTPGAAPAPPAPPVATATTVLLPTATPVPRPPTAYSFTFPSFYAEPDTFQGRLSGISLMDSIPATDFLPGASPPQGAQFAVVLMSVTNIGAEPAAVGSLSFRLRDADGRVFTLDYPELISAQFAAEEYFERAGLYDTVMPGITLDMVFVFLVPTGATGLAPERCPDTGC